MRVSVIGAGYVGLVTGTCFSDMGHDVTCMDVDEKKIAGLRKGVIPIYEPGLEEMVEANSKQGRLTFTAAMEEAVRDGQFIFIAVGTPSMEDGTADLQHVLDVARKIGAFMEHRKVIVTKSTVPVGTASPS